MHRSVLILKKKRQKKNSTILSFENTCYFSNGDNSTTSYFHLAERTTSVKTERNK